MYDHLLGGTSHDAADRAAVAKIRAVLPEVAAVAWANRIFHHRAAVWMAVQGVAQFAGLGCGLPGRVSTHMLVRRVRPAAAWTA